MLQETAEAGAALQGREQFVEIVAAAFFDVAFALDEVSHILFEFQPVGENRAFPLGQLELQFAVFFQGGRAVLSGEALQ